MSTIKRFEDLEIWQEARRLSNEIFVICNRPGLQNEFRFKDQIKSSAGSIMDNIAEGFERNGNLEFKQFLSIAKGSAGETRSQLYRLLDAGHVTQDEFDATKNSLEQLSGKINNFIIYLNKKDFKGTKFVERKL